MPRVRAPSPKLKTLIRAAPPETDGRPIDLAALLRSLRVAANAYTRAADSLDRDGWRAWVAIQRELGESPIAAVRALPIYARRSLALRASASEEPELVLAAFKSYYPRFKYRNRHDRAGYARAFVAASRVDEAVALVDSLSPDPADHPESQCEAILGLVDAGDPASALPRIRRICERHHDSSAAWAVHAIVLRALGRDEDAERALGETVMHEELEPELLARLVRAMGITQRAWKARRAPLRPAPWSRAHAPWRASPGSRIVPTDAPSPHTFGGDAFEMPDCICGRRIRTWFVLDLRAIPELHARLPSWSLFPLLGCADCMGWLGRYDYEVRDRTVRLVNAGMVSGLENQVYEHAPTIVPRPVRLVAVPAPRPRDEIGDWDHPQGGGEPAWTQEPRNMWCRTCRARMVFVAGMTTTWHFDVHIPINNESGFQYHFACDPCRTLSVIAQNT